MAEDLHAVAGERQCLRLLPQRPVAGEQQRQRGSLLAGTTYGA